MKKQIILLVSSIFFALSSHADHASSSPFAVLYTQKNFSGWSYRVMLGDSIPHFRYVQDGRWTFLDRSIESIEINGAISLEIWDEASFQGNLIVVSQSIADLSRLPSRPDHQDRYHSTPGDWSNRAVSLTAAPHRAGQEDIPPHSSSASYGQVTLHEDVGFGGDSIGFDDSVSIPDLNDFQRRAGDWNDKASSISIEGDFLVVLYEHANYEGSSIQLVSSLDSLLTVIGNGGEYENWSDRASSMEIQRIHPHAQPAPSPIENQPIAATLFEASSYRGEELQLFAGQEISNLQDIGWNDRVSSLKLRESFDLIFYEHANFEGDSIRLSKRQSHLHWARTLNNRVERWNDRVSSVRVVSK